MAEAVTEIHGRLGPIDVLGSISRLMSSVAEPAHRRSAAALRDATDRPYAQFLHLHRDQRVQHVDLDQLALAGPLAVQQPGQHQGRRSGAHRLPKAVG